MRQILPKTLTVLDAIKFMWKYWHLVTDETIQKCFSKCGFAVPAIQQEDMTEILEQEEELASLAERIRVDKSKLVIEEHLSQFDIQEEENLIVQLVG
ncbi:hypothetical protein BASA50_005828 [Batrachochytrium salamandrivorans]|uniref:DDE-1 domain-containing protein n=1 Tax=Batrachochytrium salamandrivorans TaxID=1357716 RepID=A0ABQ8FBK4_9FUNG|nr:hypothetical protein BASA60_007359 [Batrachochytrium salamandrivorans]KAH6595416.1 hypothetical protein BASA50_005828 [Batrachochytrium salamandrivorans]KAH6600823.1 hypothetical protein BASA61_002242 [Batrachochytrium salamandrivorans]KAH9266416.1 hypothetical protein BASA84_001134 [Batrachochytrium salamandrivorans]